MQLLLSLRDLCALSWGTKGDKCHSAHQLFQHYPWSRQYINLKKKRKKSIWSSSASICSKSLLNLLSFGIRTSIIVIVNLHYTQIIHFFVPQDVFHWYFPWKEKRPYIKLVQKAWFLSSGLLVQEKQIILITLFLFGFLLLFFVVQLFFLLSSSWVVNLFLHAEGPLLINPHFKSPRKRESSTCKHIKKKDIEKITYMILSQGICLNVADILYFTRVWNLAFRSLLARAGGVTSTTWVFGVLLEKTTRKMKFLPMAWIEVFANTGGRWQVVLSMDVGIQKSVS